MKIKIPAAGKRNPGQIHGGKVKLHLKINCGRENLVNEVIENAAAFSIHSPRFRVEEVEPDTNDRKLKTDIGCLYIFPEAEENDCEEIPEKHFCLVIDTKDRRREPKGVKSPEHLSKKHDPSGGDRRSSS